MGFFSRLRAGRADRVAFDDARLATYPPPFPSGWYKVADARDVRARKPIRVACAGEHLVLFRDGEGRARALDAKCPHLGADLSDGVVKDGCLECPFHHWQFRGDGTVARIPYQERVPAALRTRSWPVRELAEMIFVYHAHVERDRARPPRYELPALDEIGSGAFVPRGRRDLGAARMHILEFVENGADRRHFASVHGQLTIPWTQRTVPGVAIDHQVEWSPDPAHAHLAHFHNVATLEVLGKMLASSRATTHVTFVGPGALTLFRFSLPKVGEILLLEMHTPIAPMRVRVELRWFAQPRVPRVLVSYVVGNWASHLARDIRIWERKSFSAKPMLVENDGPIKRCRQWYEQFYAPAPERS